MKTNKPNWKDAPRWANYLAMDENGTWCWYEELPEINSEFKMWSTESEYEEIEMNEMEWESTLERRPS